MSESPQNIETRQITSRDEWLQWRKQDITASVIGALFNVHPYKTALQLYVEKRDAEFERAQQLSGARA